MNYVNCTSKKYLSQAAKYTLNTLIGGYDSTLSDTICSVLTLISDYDVSYVVEEKKINGVSKGFNLNIYNNDGDIFFDMENIVSVEDFFRVVIDFLQLQIREFYLTDLVNSIKDGSVSIDTEGGISSILNDISIIADYNAVLSNVNKALASITCEA